MTFNSRFTFGEPANITLEVLQQNGPGTVDQLLWITSIVCDEFNPNDNICNIPGKITPKNFTPEFGGCAYPRDLRAHNLSNFSST